MWNISPTGATPEQIRANGTLKKLDAVGVVALNKNILYI